MLLSEKLYVQIVAFREAVMERGHGQRKRRSKEKAG